MSGKILPKHLVLSLVALNFMAAGSAFSAAHLEFGDADTFGSWFYQDKTTPNLELPGENHSVGQFHFNLNHRLGSSTVSTFTSWDDRQKINQAGIEINGISVDAFYGEGETVSTVSNPFARIDPFLFHGGVVGDYDFNGFTLSSRLGGNSEILFSRAELDAFNLESRTANAFGFTGKSSWGTYAISFIRVERGQEHVGDAYSISVDRGTSRVGLDYLTQQNGSSFQSLRYAWGKKGTRYSLEFQRSKNPLYSVKDDNRVLFNMAFQFGPRPYRYSASAESGNGQEKDASKARFLVVGGVVGAAVLLSSGSSDSDTQPRFGSQHESAKSVLNAINPVSIAENREYGGYVYRNADGSFSNTSPIAGQAASLLLPPVSAIVPGDATARATYHTHAAFDPRFDNENFSPTDIATDITLGLDGYLGTPGGAFKYHEVSTGLIFTLGTIATQ